jgi:hypothetical protein
MREDSASREEECGENTRFSRRRLLGMSAAGGLAAARIGTPAGRAAADAIRLPRGGSGRLAAAARPRGVLGANCNGDRRVMTFRELRDVATTWVRGFFPTPDADACSPADQPSIRALLTAAGNGYGTVLSLKFPYFDEPIPAPGTLAMAAAQRRLDAVLPIVIGKLDIVAIANEPFVECQARDRDSTRLNVVYETMARHAIAYRRRSVEAGNGTRLSMGALNHPELPGGGRPRPSGGCSSCAALRRSLVPTSIHTYPTLATAGTTWTTSCYRVTRGRHLWAGSGRAGGGSVRAGLDAVAPEQHVLPAHRPIRRQWPARAEHRVGRRVPLPPARLTRKTTI